MSFLNPEMGGHRLLPHSLLAALLVFPWLSPYTAGPAPNAWPWLLSGACAVVLWLVQRRLNARIIAGGWLVAASLSALIGLCQYFGVAAHFSPWMNVPDLGVAFANLRQRNQFATLTNIALATLLWLGMQGSSSARRSWLLLAEAVLLGVGNAASSSRTGLLQLAVLYGLFALWGCWRQAAVRCVLLAAALSYALANLLLPWLAGLNPAMHGGLARLRAGDAVCSSRVTLWSNVLHLIAQKPWFGWGWGELDFAHYMTLYPGARFCDILDNAHNLPLHLAVELGIPLAAAVCAGAAWIVWRAKPWRETDPTRQMAWGVLAVIMLHSMLEYPLWYGPFQMAFGLSVWMLWPRPPGLALGPRPYAHTGAAIRLVIATALLAAVAYAAWDYHRVSQVYLAPQARDAAYRDDTMNKVRDSWLFRNQVRFAELTTTPLTRDNAQWTFDIATALLHFSPEPRVIEKVIESAFMLGREDEALAHRARYRAAFPQDHEKWAKAQGSRMGRTP